MLSVQRAEWAATPYGEALDMILCYQIHKGMANPKQSANDEYLIPINLD